MVVRKAHILDRPSRGRLQPGDYCYFLVSRQRLPRLDSLFRTSRDVARRLGLLFGELPIRGETRMATSSRSSTTSTSARTPPEARSPTGWRRG